MPVLERNKQFFSIGEFVLSIVVAATPTIGQPSSGVLFFVGESRPIVDRFLRTEGEQMKILFGDGLKDALSAFDTWGGKMANNGRCWGDGFQNGAVEAVFPTCLLYTSPSPRDRQKSRMPSSA